MKSSNKILPDLGSGGTILVTGGSGYIGSHTVVDLLQKGFQVVSLDNYNNSHKWINKRILKISGKDAAVHFHNVDICKKKKLRKIFEKYPDISGIIHFAAHKAVGESVENPLKYYDNNLSGLINILQMAEKFEVPNFLFSSSCTVYGNVKKQPVTERTAQQKPESPYGATKVMGERIVTDFIHARPTSRAVLLRYFNPAGAHPSALIGELPQNKPANLVPVITAVASGKMDHLTVFGTDYETRDGSCVRDYIHVSDLAEAHTLSMQALIAGKLSEVEIFNLGIGQGATVLEAIQAFEKVTDVKLNYKLGPRRKGDVVAIYADYQKAKKMLGWTPKYNMDDIMRTAWEWEKQLENEN
ncbi:MAG: UDP-glucose 4-epimerase GalE [Saprospiraceae bacterium]